MFARTPRLLLRPGWIEDAPALHAALGDEAVVRHLAHVPWPYRLADAQRFLGQRVAPDAARLLIFARTLGAPDLVGGIALMPAGEGAELGYWIARHAWGRGYATEAGQAVLAMADMLRLRQVDAGHFIDNPASGRVLAKLGFTPVGRTAARHCRARDRLVPTTVYARTRPGLTTAPERIAA